MKERERRDQWTINRYITDHERNFHLGVFIEGDLGMQVLHHMNIGGNLITAYPSGKNDKLWARIVNTSKHLLDISTKEGIQICQPNGNFSILLSNSGNILPQISKHNEGATIPSPHGEIVLTGDNMCPHLSLDWQLLPILKNLPLTTWIQSTMAEYLYNCISGIQPQMIAKISSK